MALIAVGRQMPAPPRRSEQRRRHDARGVIGFMARLSPGAGRSRILRAQTIRGGNRHGPGTPERRHQGSTARQPALQPRRRSIGTLTAAGTVVVARSMAGHMPGNLAKHPAAHKGAASPIITSATPCAPCRCAHAKGAMLWVPFTARRRVRSSWPRAWQDTWPATSRNPQPCPAPPAPSSARPALAPMQRRDAVGAAHRMAAGVGVSARGVWKYV